MYFITNSDHSEMIVNSISSVNSANHQHGGNYMLPLLSDNILNKLNEVTKNTKLLAMNGGKQTESEESGTEQSEQSDTTDNTDSISSLSSTTSTSFKKIQSGGKPNTKPKLRRKYKPKSKGRTKPKVRVDVFEQGTYSIQDGNYILSDSNLFTVSG